MEVSITGYTVASVSAAILVAAAFAIIAVTVPPVWQPFYLKDSALRAKAGTRQRQILAADFRGASLSTGFQLELLPHLCSARPIASLCPGGLIAIRSRYRDRDVAFAPRPRSYYWLDFRTRLTREPPSAKPRISRVRGKFGDSNIFAVGPSSMIRPFSITTTRSAQFRANSSSWVTTTMV